MLTYTCRNHELIGQGAANILAGACGSLPNILVGTKTPHPCFPFLSSPGDANQAISNCPTRFSSPELGVAELKQAL